MAMMLKPQDVFVLLKLISLNSREWSYSTLARELYMSPSEVHSGLKRASMAKLYDSQRRKPIRKALEEFIVHGVRYAYPPELGGLTRGIPTSYAAPPLKGIIAQPQEEPPVWPYAEGQVLGFSFSPLFKSVPRAVADDAKLYELLALIDAIRGGRARERNCAVRELKIRLSPG